MYLLRLVLSQLHFFNEDLQLKTHLTYCGIQLVWIEVFFW